MKITAYINEHNTYIKGKGWTTALFIASIYDENNRPVNYMEDKDKKSLIKAIKHMYNVSHIHDRTKEV